MRYLERYRSEPRVVDFFSLASDCLVHGEMLVLALGTPYSTPDDQEHYRPGFTDNVNLAMQRFFGIDGRFGREIKPPIDGQMFSHSILYQYRGDKSKICRHFGWAIRPAMPTGYRPVVTTLEVDPDTEGSGWYLLIDDVVVDHSWKEVDLFDDVAEARLDDPRRAYAWRESAKVLNAIVRKPARDRSYSWCEIGAHEMKSASEAYCYTFRDLMVCRECMENHNATIGAVQASAAADFYRCNRCHEPMIGLTCGEDGACSGACECGGLIEADPRNFAK